MVAGKVAGIGISLVVLVIAVAIVIRFGSSLNIGERLSEGLQGASNSINDFFGSLLPEANAQTANVPALDLSQPGEGKPNPANNPTNPTPVDLIVNDPNKTDAQKKQEIIDRIPPEQKVGVNGFDRVFRPDGSEKFNPPNTVFFGVTSINEGRGLKTDSKEAKQVEEFLAKGGNLADISILGESSLFGGLSFDNLPFGFPTIPAAFAQEPTKVNAQPQNKIEKSNPVTSGQKSINVKGEVKGVKIDGAFSADGSNVQAIIRPTPVDRSRLLTDSNKNPIETASQRANRVFNETGDFADTKRGATSISKTKNSNFDFGTNTGSGQKGSTEAATKQNRIERLAREAEKARAVFDSGSISNF